MRILPLAAIIGATAEGLLWGADILFGKFSFVNSENSNALGGIVFLFHLPGGLLAQYLFVPPANFSGVYLPGLIFVRFIGAIQFTLIAWLGLAIYRKWTRQKAA
jgi:hypothetical protein